MTDDQEIDSKIATVLADTFGLKTLYPYQELVIRNTLDHCLDPDSSRREQIVVLPTGFGKSLCFLLPGLILPGITIIVYPLLSLMSDQARRLTEKGISVSILRGGQSSIDRDVIFRRLDSGESRFLLTNPETLCRAAVVARLSSLTVPISHVVIDEAHTVCEWGDSFRPAYLKVGEILQTLSVNLVTACTATSSPRIRERITHLLFTESTPALIDCSPDRPTMHYRVLPSLSITHDLISLLKAPSCQKPLIVFCTTRKETVKTARDIRLRLPHQEVRHYHAGLSRAERDVVETWFFSSRDGILCATSAYGMGVDKGDIHTIIHIGISESPEAFLQESGRAGRDGAPCSSIVLIDLKEVVRARERLVIRCLLSVQDGAGWIIEDSPSSDHKRWPLVHVFVQRERCRRALLLELLGHRIETCFGCDVCDGEVYTTPDGHDEIIRLVRLYPGVFSIHTASITLSGRLSLQAREQRLYRFRGFGVLSTWDQEDITEAIETLIETRALTARHRRRSRSQDFHLYLGDESRTVTLNELVDDIQVHRTLLKMET